MPACCSADARTAIDQCACDLGCHCACGLASTMTTVVSIDHSGCGPCLQPCLISPARRLEVTKAATDHPVCGPPSPVQTGPLRIFLSLHPELVERAKAI